MNKLVIIGNGFDLAHELPTRYEDFLLWEINEAFKQISSHIKSPLFEVESYNIICDQNYEPLQFGKVSDFLKFQKEQTENITINYPYPFIGYLIKFAENNWVDIEKEYYKWLVAIFNNYERNENLDIEALKELNKGFDLIKSELEKYLSTIKTNLLQIDLHPDIIEHFNTDINDSNTIKNSENIFFLNFNYTDTINNYVRHFKFENSAVNFIHGKLNDKNNPIIFGYGDETDKYYEKIEDLKDNEFLKYMKSFAYLQSSNYKHLFEFLDQEDLPLEKREKFNVYIMGHSCGVSDRLLFTHIFEHPLMNSVKLYYYQYGEKESDNDFFQKTQELSRHFRKDAKHKMRKCVVPFNESKLLTTYKP